MSREREGEGYYVSIRQHMKTHTHILTETEKQLVQTDEKRHHFSIKVH